MTNIELLKETALLAAAHRLAWCPQTDRIEMEDSTEEIITLAESILREIMGTAITLTDYDLCHTLWGWTEDDYMLHLYEQSIDLVEEENAVEI